MDLSCKDWNGYIIFCFADLFKNLHIDMNPKETGHSSLLLLTCRVSLCS